MVKTGRPKEQVAIDAINYAMKALKKRHLLEEGAHAPAFLALSRPIVSQVRTLSLTNNFYGFLSYLFLTHKYPFFLLWDRKKLVQSWVPIE